MTSTPPPRKRNPAVTIRRVQSERKYLSTPWMGGPPVPPPPPPPVQFMRTHHEYAPRTAIIPSPHHHAMLSSGMLWHQAPPMVQPSQAMMQPFMFVAPPLIISSAVHQPMPLAGGLREEDLLARDRLETFFNRGEASPHKPRSLLSSYPDSHVYESLISQMSEMTDENQSSSKQDLQVDGLKSPGKQAPNLPPDRIKETQKNIPPHTAKDDQNSKKKDVCSHCNKLKLAKRKNNEEIDGSVCGKYIFDSPAKNPTIKFSSKASSTPDISANFRANESVVPILADLSKLISHLEGSKTPICNSIRKEVQLQESSDSSAKISPYQKLKALVKSKFRVGNQDIYEEIAPTPTAVSVVHINKDSGEDEVKVRASVCYKCDGTIRRKDFVGDDNYLISSKVPQETSRKIQTKLKRATSPKSNLRDQNRRIARESNTLVHQRPHPIIPKTVELPETGLNNATLGNNCTHYVSTKSDKATQVNPESILAGRSPHADSATLDPLRPTYRPQNTSNPIKRTKTFASRGNLESLGTFEKKFPKVSLQKEIKNTNRHSNESKRDVQQMTLQFDSEDSSSNYDYSGDSWNFENEYGSLYSSLLDANPQLCLDDLNSLVLVYNASRNPKLMLPSKYKITTPISVPRNGGSSGLGSSGSYSSFEDLPSSGLGSSVSFVEPSFCSSTLTIGSRGSLRFDYSKSWDHLNEKVSLQKLNQKKTKTAQQESHSNSPLKRAASNLLSVRSALPWTHSKETSKP